MIDLSVVIPTYNRLEMLRHVVPSLLRQTLPQTQYELLICDSQSSDGTAAYLAEVSAEHPLVRHLPGPYSGRAMARNAGIEAARGEILLFNDADIIASPDLLGVHLERHRSRQRVAVVGWEVQCRTLEEYARKRDDPHVRGSLHPPSRKTLDWLYFLTGNASARRDVLLTVGGFDESFTGYGHEDLELGYRLRKAGITIVYEPRAVSYHCQDIGDEDQFGKMELAGRSTVRFYRKHRAFEVMAKLGMTPFSLGLHSVLTKAPWMLRALRARSVRSKFARSVVQQYHYVSGIKAALRQS